jgi:hypothetical protein
LPTIHFPFLFLLLFRQQSTVSPVSESS